MQVSSIRETKGLSMKSRIDRNPLLSKEAQKELSDFRVFLKVKDGIAQQAVAAMLYAYHLQGYRKKRLQDMFERIMSIINLPPTPEGSMDGTSLMEFISKEYGIDFDRIKLQTETEKEYLERVIK